MKLTPHFDSSEFIYSDIADKNSIDNSPDIVQLANIAKTAAVLEDVRALLGHKPITVTSGFRCRELNTAVGGVHDSAHLDGLAADVVSPGFGTVLELYQRIAPHVMQLGIDQLIHEHGPNGVEWVHVGLTNGAPRNQCLTV